MDGYGYCYQVGMITLEVVIKKIQRFLCIILLFILCASTVIMWGGGSVLHSSVMSKQASHDFMRSQFRSDIFEDNEMPPLKNYSDEDVEYPVDGRSLII
jgi:hypothetical protein